MAEDTGFLGRWSRLKRTAQAEKAPPADPPEPLDTASLPATIPCDPAETVEPPALPPLDSLDADSDYTAFLKQGVPAEMRRLALRRAWASDPKIADFRGFGEYDWDYNAPGYGALRPTDDIKRLVDAIFPDEKPPPVPEEEPEQAIAADEVEDGVQDEVERPSTA